MADIVEHWAVASRNCHPTLGVHIDWITTSKHTKPQKLIYDQKKYPQIATFPHICTLCILKINVKC
jgi:hypothetical protein